MRYSKSELAELKLGGITWSDPGKPEVELPTRTDFLVHDYVDVFSRGSSKALADLGQQPVVYVWFLVNPDMLEQRFAYVGQTTNLLRRTRRHLEMGGRMSNGRRILRETRRGFRVYLAWRAYRCDCPLDDFEGEAIRCLVPEWNQSFGPAWRLPGCDSFCVREPVE